jgi:hypothetical protein
MDKVKPKLSIPKFSMKFIPCPEGVIPEGYWNTAGTMLITLNEPVYNVRNQAWFEAGSQFVVQVRKPNPEQDEAYYGYYRSEDIKRMDSHVLFPRNPIGQGYSFHVASVCRAKCKLKESCLSNEHLFYEGWSYDNFCQLSRSRNECVYSSNLDFGLDPHAATLRKLASIFVYRLSNANFQYLGGYR